LLPIDELRDYFINQDYLQFNKVETKRNSLDYCYRFTDFFIQTFKYGDEEAGYICNPKSIKDLIIQKFDPIAQHDSQEFMIFTLGMLQDEQTPHRSVFDGGNEKKDIR